MTLEETIKIAPTLPGYLGMLYSEYWESAVILCAKEHLDPFFAALDVPKRNDPSVTGIEFRNGHRLLIVTSAEFAKDELERVRDTWLRCDGVFANL